MYRDFQFYDSRIVDYTRIGETLTLFCVYGIHEKWRTCFYRVKDLVGEDFLVGSVISFFGYEHPGSDIRCSSATPAELQALSPPNTGEGSRAGKADMLLIIQYSYGVLKSTPFLFHIALLLDKLRSGVYNFMEVKKNFQYPLENLLNLWYNYDIVPG